MIKDQIQLSHFDINPYNCSCRIFYWENVGSIFFSTNFYLRKKSVRNKHKTIENIKHRAIYEEVGPLVSNLTLSIRKWKIKKYGLNWTFDKILFCITWASWTQKEIAASLTHNKQFSIHTCSFQSLIYFTIPAKQHNAFDCFQLIP